MKHFAIIISLSASLIACGSSQKSTQSTSADSTKTEVQQTPRVQPLAQNELKSVLAKDSVILIDVRTPGEVNSGYIPEADEFIDIRSSDFQSRIQALDPNYTYVMYCRSGARSGQAANFMVQNGFTKVYNLTGGIMGYKGELKRP